MFTFLLALNLTVSTFAQQKKNLFSDAISLHLKKYKVHCQDAVYNNDYERVRLLFDSLVKNHLKGTFIDDLSIKKLDGGLFKTEVIKNPILLATTTSWYIKNDEEIKAINQLAEEFKGKVDIVVLFWDSKKKIKTIAKQYHKDVIITYVDEASNKDNSIINTYKHALGFPTAFYITTEKQIVSIDRGGTVKFTPNMDSELYASNYNLYHRNMIKLLLNDELSKETILSITD